MATETRIAIYEHGDGSQPFIACPRHSEGASQVADLPEGHSDTCHECEFEAWKVSREPLDRQTPQN